MKRVLMLAVFGLGLACGGGSSGGPTFTYGASGPVTDPGDQSVLYSGQAELGAIVDNSAVLDPSSAFAMGFPNVSMFSAGMDAGASSSPIPAAFKQKLPAMIAQAAAGVFACDSGSVETDGVTYVTYNQCVFMDAEYGDLTIDGSVDLSATATAGRVTWDFTVDFVLTGEGSLSDHSQGDVTVTSTSATTWTVQGWSSNAASISAQGNTLGWNTSESIDVDGDDLCQGPTNGTYQVELVWTAYPPEYASHVHNVGLLFTWDGTCDGVTVAHSL